MATKKRTATGPATKTGGSKKPAAKKPAAKKPAAKPTGKTSKRTSQTAKKPAAKTAKRPLRGQSGVPAGQLRCPACGTVKPEAEFHKNTSKPTGRQTNCKACNRHAAAERRTQALPARLATLRRHNGEDAT